MATSNKTPVKRAAPKPVTKRVAPRKARDLVVGSRVEFKSRNNAGKGVVSAIEAKATGEWFTVKTKDHPKGTVTVRRSQVS